MSSRKRERLKKKAKRVCDNCQKVKAKIADSSEGKVSKLDLRLPQKAGSSSVHGLTSAGDQSFYTPVGDGIYELLLLGEAASFESLVRYGVGDDVEYMTYNEDYVDVHLVDKPELEVKEVEVSPLGKVTNSPGERAIAFLGHEEFPRLQSVRARRCGSEDEPVTLELELPTSALSEIMAGRTEGAGAGELTRELSAAYAERMQLVQSASAPRSQITTRSYRAWSTSWESALAEVSSANAGLRRYQRYLLSHAQLEPWMVSELELAERGIGYNNGCAKRLKRKEHCYASPKAGVERGFSYRAFGASSSQSAWRQQLVDALSSVPEQQRARVTQRLSEATLSFEVDRYLRGSEGDQLWSEAVDEAAEARGCEGGAWRARLDRRELHYSVVSVNERELVVVMEYTIIGDYAEIWELGQGLVSYERAEHRGGRRALSVALADHEWVTLSEREVPAHPEVAQDVRDAVDDDVAYVIEAGEGGAERGLLSFATERYGGEAKIEWRAQDACTPDVRAELGRMAARGIVQSHEAWRRVQRVVLDCAAGEVELEFIEHGQEKRQKVPKSPSSEASSYRH